jgi:hypothetical protein
MNPACQQVDTIPIVKKSQEEITSEIGLEKPTGAVG